MRDVSRRCSAVVERGDDGKFERAVDFLLMHFAVAGLLQRSAGLVQLLFGEIEPLGTLEILRA